MITIENVLEADKDIQAVWEFFNDVNSIAESVPTCQGYRMLDEDTVEVDLRLKLGLIPLDSMATIKIIERAGNHRLVAEGVTEAGESLKKYGKLVTETVTKLRIELNLSEESPKRTKIHFIIQADAVGQMRRIYEAIIKGQRDKMESQFIRNVEDRLGAKVQVRGLEAA